jgi:hypothetical protein
LELYTSGRDIVCRHIPKNVIEGLFLGDIFAYFRYDDAELNFEVNVEWCGPGEYKWCGRGEDASIGFEEYYGDGRDFEV